MKPENMQQSRHQFVPKLKNCTCIPNINPAHMQKECIHCTNFRRAWALLKFNISQRAPHEALTLADIAQVNKILKIRVIS